MSRVTSSRLNRIRLPGFEPYRGFKIGYFEDSPGGRYQITAAWKWPDGEWDECHLLLRTVNEVLPCAKDCIDYAIVVRAMERVLGRSLELKELPFADEIPKYDRTERKWDCLPVDNSGTE